MKLVVDCEISPEWLAETQISTNNSALHKLLAKGKHHISIMPLEALVCESFGINASPDYPIAAMMAAIDELDTSCVYIRANPVSLTLQRDCFVLSTPAICDLTIPESTALMLTFNQHFEQENLIFILGKSSSCWYVKLDQTFAEKFPIQTILPHAAIGQNIHHNLPTGKGAVKWISILNELQMLLHDHPINLAREKAGLSLVNSIWLSGGGKYPNVASLSLPNHYDQIMANQTLHQGLGQLFNIPCTPLPDQFDNIFTKSVTSMRLALPFRKKIAVDRFFDQAFVALSNNTISELILNFGVHANCITTQIKPIDLYKIWRKNTSFSTFINQQLTA